MMRTRSVLLALAIVTLFATEMSAQMCAGKAAFSSGPVRLGAGLGTSVGEKSYDVNMAVGAKFGGYVSGDLTRFEYSDVDGSSRSVGLDAGWAINLNPSRTVQFCPEIGYQRESLPDTEYVGNKLTTSIRAVSYGGTFGGTVAVLPALDLVPYAGAYYVSARATVTLASLSQSESWEYGELDAGAGFVIDKTLTLRPAVVIPFGVSGAKSTLLIGVAFNFGKH